MSSVSNVAIAGQQGGTCAIGQGTLARGKRIRGFRTKLARRIPGYCSFTATDGLRDLGSQGCLDVENVLDIQGPIKRVCPEMGPVLGTGQSRTYAQTVSRVSHAAIDDVIDAALASDTRGSASLPA